MRRTALRAAQEAHLISPLGRRRIATAVAMLAAGYASTAAAAEISVSGTGTFKPPSAEQLAKLPADLPFTRADLETGTWSFVAHYDDGAADRDADPYVGRYAVRLFRVTIGKASFDLPAAQAEIAVSDGGLRFMNRESIRVEARSAASASTLRVGWVQANQQIATTDLRGAAGALPSDTLPPVTQIANFETAHAFDRYLYLRVDDPNVQAPSRPLLYLSTANLSVTAAPVAAH